MKFLKFEFLDQAEWLTYKATLSTTIDGVTIYNYPVVAVVELGNICTETNPETGECTNSLSTWAVDMLLDVSIPEIEPFIVWPNPDGVHIFAGWSAAYTQEFCKINPDSPYCIINID